MEEKSTKKRQWYNIVLDVVTIVLLVVVLFFGITAISSIGKDYNSLFGVSSVAVRTGSMDAGYKAGDKIEFEGKEITCKQGGFKANDLIFINILDKDRKAINNLEVGDVITFRTSIEDEKQGVITTLLTHRIVKVHTNADGSISAFTTKGDVAKGIDTPISPSAVIGVYSGHKMWGFGGVILFLKSTWGFFTLIVLPCFLILGYTIYLLVKAIREERKEALAEAVASGKASVFDEDKERERIKQELLNEMNGSKEEQIKSAEVTEPTATETAEAEPVTEPVVETEVKEPAEEKPADKVVEPVVEEKPAEEKKPVAKKTTTKKTTAKKTATKTAAKKPAAKKTTTAKTATKKTATKTAAKKPAEKKTVAKKTITKKTTAKKDN